MTDLVIYNAEKICKHNQNWGRRDWDFRISDLVKTLMELIFNSCGEFR